MRTLRASIEGFFGNKRYGVPGYASDGGYAVILVTVCLDFDGTTAATVVW